MCGRAKFNPCVTLMPSRWARLAASNVRCRRAPRGVALQYLDANMIVTGLRCKPLSQALL
jgi:hypothetical protein